MVTTLQRNEDNKKKVGAVAVGVAGAVAIAGAAVATTMALRDEKIRKNVKNMLTNVKDHAIDYVDTFRTKSNAEKVTDKIRKIATSTKRIVKKA